MEFQEYISIALSTLTLGAMIFAIFKFFRDPDVRVDKQLSISTATCTEKHKRIDEIIIEFKDSMKNIENTMLLLKENDIKHIELNTYGVNEKIARMEGKMDTLIELGKENLKK